MLVLMWLSGDPQQLHIENAGVFDNKRGCITASLEIAFTAETEFGTVMDRKCLSTREGTVAELIPQKQFFDQGRAGPPIFPIHPDSAVDAPKPSPWYDKE